MDSWGNETSKSGFILTTQSDLNTRTGFAYARQNQQYPTITARFLNDGSFTIAPQEIFPANIEAADNNRGLAWTPDLIPRQIRRTYNHQGGYFEVQITFEPSTTGPAGETVIMPAEPPSATGGGVSPINDPPPPPPAWPPPTVPIPGPAVGADTTDGAYWTLNSGASWEERNNLLTVPQRAMQYLIWDPWWFTAEKQGTNDPEQVILWGCGLGFIVRSEDAGKTWQDVTQNIDTPPNTAGDSPAPAVVDVTFLEVHGDIHSKNRFVVPVNWISSANIERSWIIETTDDGVTWTWTELTASTGGGTNPNTLTWLLDADPDQEAYSDDDPVTTITNQGTGINGTGGTDPTFKTGIINGHSVYRFVRANQEYKTFSTTFGKPANYTIFSVFNYLNSINDSVVLGSANAVAGDRFTQWGKIHINQPTIGGSDRFACMNSNDTPTTGYSSNYITNKISSNKFHIVAIRYTNGDTFHDIWHNGKQVATTSFLANSSVNSGTVYPFVIGRNGNVSGGAHMDGDVGRQLLVTSALTDNQIENISDWLVDYYAIQQFKALTTYIDLETGTTLYTTLWDGTLLKLENRQSSDFSTISQSSDFGGAALEDITARTFWIGCYCPPFFGTASLNDIVYAFGRWDDGTVRHISKSTDGGASFSDIGDSATWTTGWVGAFFADDSSTLYAFVNGGSRALYRSVDSGSNWTNLSLLPFDVEPGGVSKHPDGRILIINRDAGPAMAAYAIAPDYSSWIDATGSPSFSTTGGGSKAIIWVT
jgi:hypothetical protein